MGEIHKNLIYNLHVITVIIFSPKLLEKSVPEFEYKELFSIFIQHICSKGVNTTVKNKKKSLEICLNTACI